MLKFAKKGPAALEEPATEGGTAHVS
jgi:cytochrome d ubiquinol oxidase subunit I